MTSKIFVDAIAQCVLDNKPADLDALLAMTLADGVSVEETRKNLIAKIGENMSVRRFEVIESKGQLASYKHGERIGVVVNLEGDDEALGKDIAMHIAASNPACISEADVDPALIEKERDIFVAQAAESGKPPEIVEKMVGGRIKKYLKEVTLLGQPFVKDPDQTIAQLLDKAGASVTGFVRYQVGEGIEKKSENFAEEVAAQMKG